MFLTLSVFSNDEVDSPFEYTEWITKELDKIKDIQPVNYFREIDSHRGNIEKYIDHKKRVCNGEFSTFVLTNLNKGKSDKDNKGLRNKLSKTERKLCFRELKAIQVTMINNMFLARKKYLTYLHETRLKELSDTRNRLIENLHKSFNRGRNKR